ncbi:MAG: hypothetical protein OEM02_07075 [Desulfobulbaceae bacterium]|nr:hypothetical protein [Desulfobulbaceae bacterium]
MRNSLQKNRLLLFLSIALFLFSGCATVPGTKVADGVAPILAQQEFNENELLNVSIKIFDPGELPIDQEEQSGLTPEIREAEARFVPIHLKYTMQRSGYWGAVRVVPDDDTGAELLVRGTIAHSDGESMSLTIEAVDARNVVWFQKTYSETARLDEHRHTEPEKNDTFQDLFNTIANDLASHRARLPANEILEIRKVAELRYGESMVPDAFQGYLGTDKNNRYRLVRLPPRNDPMLTRMQAVRSRDDMLVDSINGHYDLYYQEMWEPYNNWRAFRTEEVTAMRKLESEALSRQLLGIASIIGAIAISVAGDSDVLYQTADLRGLMVYGGAAAIYSGTQKREETEMNKVAIKELGESFSSEAQPLVLDVEGETVRLTGSAEEQYTAWRRLLKKLYAKETGLPLAPAPKLDEKAAP